MDIDRKQASQTDSHVPDHQWVTTVPNPRAPATGFDAGQRGWKLHLADLAQPGAAAHGKNRARSLCGIMPRHGWGLDLFVAEPCARCEARARKLGVPLPPRPV